MLFFLQLLYHFAIMSQVHTLAKIYSVLTCNDSVMLSLNGIAQVEVLFLTGQQQPLHLISPCCYPHCASVTRLLWEQPRSDRYCTATDSTTTLQVILFFFPPLYPEMQSETIWNSVASAISGHHFYCNVHTAFDINSHKELLLFSVQNGMIQIQQKRTANSKIKLQFC